MIVLCGLDPRFEEALLVLGSAGRTLILGKEDVGYVPIVPIDVEVVCCPTFSLMGIDRTGGPTLEAALRDAGIGSGDRVGVVGWKALQADEWSGRGPAIFAPACFVDTLREITGGPDRVVDATPALTSPRSGLRAFATADQIAVFEWGASRCSAWVHAILGAARPGVSEREAFRAAGWGGEPLSFHPVFASGPDVAVGLRSPSSRRLELGDAAVAAIGLWGGNCARGGIVAASERDLTSASDGYLERLAVPYWRAMATWYETLELGVPGGEVFDTVTALLEGEAFASSLNPGHLIHYEEWMDSPIRAGSEDPIASGMVVQSDIIPTGIRPGWTVNCEDTVAIADGGLREQLQARHPELWSRIRARQDYVRATLGVARRDEVLPLSCTAAYLTPFWLAPTAALVFT
jgi:Xaa-Pro aminopeptidase